MSREFKLGDKVVPIKIIHEVSTGYKGKYLNQVRTLKEYCTYTGVIGKCWRDEDNIHWYNEELRHATIADSIQERKKNKNLIEIDYQELEDGQVRVLAVRNLLTWSQLRKKFGDRITGHYEQGLHAWLSIDGEIMISGRGLFSDTITVPSLLDRTHFSTTIESIQKAGENLSRFVREHRQNKPTLETKTIFI